MFKHQIRIAYREVTVGNHVYYARYLDILEVSRNEAFRAWGVPLLRLQEEHVIFPVVECNLRYHSPARYDDLLTNEITISELGKVQFTIHYQIKKDSSLLVTATTRHVATNLEEKPVRIPQELHTVLSSHLSSADQGFS